MQYNIIIKKEVRDMVDRDDLQTAVNLIIIGEALIKAGKTIKKRLASRKKDKKKRPRKRKHSK